MEGKCCHFALNLTGVIVLLHTFGVLAMASKQGYGINLFATCFPAH